MPAQRTETLNDRTLWVVGALAAVGLAGILAATSGLATGQSWSIVLGTAALSGGAVVALDIRRARAMRRLERAATRMLAAEVPGRSGSPDIGALLLDDAATPRELRPLAAALTGLGHRIEGALKDLAKKGRNLGALIDAIDEPILATDDRARVLICNRSAEAMLDAAPGGLIGRPIGDLFTQQAILEMHAQARVGQTRRERVQAATPLGMRVFQVSATPLPAAWGEGVFGAVLALRDVTELAQAVQVKTDFVANASHELRTPVAAIRGAAETLSTAADDPAMTERLHGMILNHALRLEELLRDLLDLSRLESHDAPVQVEPVDLARIEHSIRALLDEHCRERRLTLAFEFDPRLRGLRTDGRLLTLILRNLVENSAKFAHEESAVRIVGSVLEDSRAAPGGAGNATVRFEVIDRGVGIPVQYQERVFERFFQVDQARSGGASTSAGSATPATGQAGPRRGTGLGLAIVKHAAKALGGRAGLSSVWGRGTTVFVEFPCWIEEERGEGTAERDRKGSAP